MSNTPTRAEVEGLLAEHQAAAYAAGIEAAQESAAADRAYTAVLAAYDALAAERDKLTLLAATLLCELGRAPDPRVADLKAESVQRIIARGPSGGVWRIPKPLSAEQAQAIVQGYLTHPTPPEEA